jgi:hypothetical protein
MDARYTLAFGINSPVYVGFTKKVTFITAVAVTSYSCHQLTLVHRSLIFLP